MEAGLVFVVAVYDEVAGVHDTCLAGLGYD